MSSFQQIADFRDECDCLAEVLDPLADADFERATLFKGQFMAERRGRLNLRELTDEWFEGKRNRAVYDVWREYYPKMCERLEGVDPRRRVEWFGPPMSVRSSVTARQMETWAHGQEVFDVLGLDRDETDRVRNIVFLGFNTFGWTYAVRGLEVPGVVPALELTAPSGEVWTWNADETTNRITGAAVEFAQVVTQVRNIADTSLEVVGPVATEWMSMAQCFAGGPEEPPAPGTRHKAGLKGIAGKFSGDFFAEGRQQPKMQHRPALDDAFD